MNDVFIVAAKRTPIGSFNGTLSQLTAPQLGAVAIAAAVRQAGLEAGAVEEVIMGHVLSANTGQSPATQAAVLAGLHHTPSMAVNKVCASGMKAVMMAAQSIAMGHLEVAVAGGMESMSNVPYYLGKARQGYRLGHGSLEDGLLKDGLWDVYNNFHMGEAAELCADKYRIGREEQDAYAAASYTRANAAVAGGLFAEEIAPVALPKGKGETAVDEEPGLLNLEKMPGLRTVFRQQGTVTAANASPLSDGAAALVLMSGNMVGKLGVKPLARIVSYADAQLAPADFTIAPATALPLALKRAGLKKEEVDFFEINEAFSVVALANTKLMGLQPAKINVNGGAVALGHPLGASGARILVSLLYILRQRQARTGAAAICNGGGGASAMVVESL
jgi:acetyl-CoA C-acetyltransferase